MNISSELAPTAVTDRAAGLLPPPGFDQQRTHLVTFITEQRTRLFDELLLARMVVRQLKSQTDARTLAYVVMPDHVHWLLEIRNNSPLESVIQTAKFISARNINAFYGRNGRVWQKGFHNHPLRSGDDLKYIARFLITNPIRAGLAKTVREYSHWDAVWL
jgi:REP element-mobilizing transposase RayT